jgi:YD repeat-containing protein
VCGSVRLHALAAATATQPHAPSAQTRSGGASGTTSCTYDAAGHLISTTGSSQSQFLTWDNAGNLLIDQDPYQTYPPAKTTGMCAKMTVGKDVTGEDLPSRGRGRFLAEPD